ncbi:hypothetical protein ACS0TY_025041 [Phlomoides rotata]
MPDEILASLGSLMASHSPPLDALVVRSEDYHQSECVSAMDKRHKFVSGFMSSSGLALITANKALLCTDGRYFLQAEHQLSNKWKLMRTCRSVTLATTPTVEEPMELDVPHDLAKSENLEPRLGFEPVELDLDPRGRCDDLVAC